MNILRCNQLSIGYGKNIVLSNINFEIQQGDFLAIVGENGSGKSTLMKTILGLLPCLSGEIHYNNMHVGYLPQRSEMMKEFPATVKEIVLSGNISSLKRKFFYTSKDRKKAKKWMKKLNIEEIENCSYQTLSGGQQQRVLLARALCACEDILLLDEPVTGLDPKATSDLYDILMDLNHNQKITIVMISHDIASVLRYATHILSVGKELFFGTKEQFLEKTGGMYDE